MPSLIGTILLENLRLVVAGAAALSYERNGKTEAVLMKENALLPPMGGWGVRVYSVWSDTRGKHKWMRAVLDTNEEEKRRISREVEILQNRSERQVEQFDKREKQLRSCIATLEAETRKKVKEAAAMRSLLEQEGVACGEDLNLVVEAVVSSLEPEVEGEDNGKQSIKGAEVKGKEVGSRSPLRSLNCCQEEEEEKVGGTGGTRDYNLQSSPLPAYSYNPSMLQSGAIWDSHCHLDILASRLQRVGVRRGENLEVTLERDGEGLEDKFGGCVANFCDPRSWADGRGGREVVKELRSCMAQSRVFLAIGCHPRFADRLGSLQLQRLELLARGKEGGLVAIGECGLDLSQNNKLPLTVQKKAFSEQVSLALRLKLPLVLHIRMAEKEGRQLLHELGVPPSWPMHRHCFKGCYITFLGIDFLLIIPNHLNLSRFVGGSRVLAGALPWQQDRPDRSGHQCPCEGCARGGKARSP